MYVPLSLEWVVFYDLASKEKYAGEIKIMMEVLTVCGTKSNDNECINKDTFIIQSY